MNLRCSDALDVQQHTFLTFKIDENRVCAEIRSLHSNESVREFYLIFPVHSFFSISEWSLLISLLSNLPTEIESEISFLLVSSVIRLLNATFVKFSNFELRKFRFS